MKSGLQGRVKALESRLREQTPIGPKKPWLPPWLIEEAERQSVQLRGANRLEREPACTPR